MPVIKKYFYIVIFPIFLFAQKPAKPSAVELYSQIQKLNTLGSVLYIAAHPDDENTRLISWLANDKKVETAYLSLTRGDGGQNLIGHELRELLGVIRTQELIEARKVDGGQQFFTRANDFGFSKNPDETLKIWNKDEVLADVVWAIRKFQPDIIINRFDHRTSGNTHGHHTASALLSMEAFEKAASSEFAPEQLNFCTTWQPKKVFFNPSWWFFGSQEKFEKADKSNYSKLDIGTYYSSIGKSNQEIAAISRSKHQSQGFGSTGTRGEDIEYLEFLKGTKSKDINNIFEGIDMTWNRVENGVAVGLLISEIEKNFDFKNPASSVPELIKAYQLIQKINDEHWKKIKTEELKNIITGCLGLYLEAVSDTQELTPGSYFKIKFEAINRSIIPVKISEISLNFDKYILEKNIDLQLNKSFIKTITSSIPFDYDYTNPYWLNEKETTGMYTVKNQMLIGIPDVIRNLNVIFNLEINGVTIPFERNIVYKYNDDAKGEMYQPVDVVPVVTSELNNKVYIFNNDRSKTITVKITAGKDNISGVAKLSLPTDWKCSPEEIPFKIDKKGEEVLAVFNVTPSKEISEVEIKSIVTIDNQNYNLSKTDINYSHIYKQMVLKPAVAKGLRLKIKTKDEKIGYIMGAGDEVPNCLQQMGYEVTVYKPEEINQEILENLDVVITGIRAYNILNSLALKQHLLLDFVKNGKNMIVQYNTTDDVVTPNFSPYKLKISRDRVTEEDADVRFLNPQHSILNYPNKITSEDFKGWKQEQGLYYPNEWDNHFTPILSSNDSGEKPKDGALLIAKYGKGNYIYTGLSFFRELPEGVSGAYRLFANLIAAKN